MVRRAVAWGARIALHVRQAGCRAARLTGNGIFPQSLTRRYDAVDGAWACIAAVIVGSRAARASGDSAGAGPRRCTHPADAVVWAVIAPGPRTRCSEGCIVSGTEGRGDGRGPSRLRGRLSSQHTSRVAAPSVAGERGTHCDQRDRWGESPEPRGSAIARARQLTPQAPESDEEALWTRCVAKVGLIHGSSRLSGL